MTAEHLTRLIVDPPLLECPHCGGEEYAVSMQVSGTICEMRSMRTGELADNPDLWEGAVLSTPRRHVTCASCHARIGTVVGEGTSCSVSKEPVVKVVRISTLGLVEDGRILLVRKRGLDMFILPGGKQEPGEDDRAALAREVLEELGCRLRGRPRFVGVFRDAAGGAPGVEVEVTMHSARLAGTPRAMAEIEEIRWVDLAEPDVPVAPSLSNLIMPYLLAMQRTRKG